MNNKISKKHLKFIIPSIGALLLLVVLIFTLIVPKVSSNQSFQYKKALRLIKREDYNEAFEILYYLEDYKDSKEQLNNIREYVTSIEISDSKTSIESYEFAGYTNLKEVIIPEGVTLINSYAFSGCSRLKNVELPSSLTAIYDSAFRNCGSLVSITIPSSVNAIGNYAFRYCNNLTIYCEIDNKPKTWQKRWNDSERPVYFGVNKDNYYEEDGLEFIKQNDSLLLSGYSGDSNKIKIPSSLNIKGKDYTINSIGNYAFSYRDNITGILIPEDITYIGEGSFRGCENLLLYCEVDNEPSEWNELWNSSNVPVNWGVKEYIEKDDFEYALINNELVVTRYVGNNNEIIIPSNIENNGVSYEITKIGNAAFINSNIKKIELPNTLKEINDYAFSGCLKLEEVNIPDGVERIGAYSFYNCRSLLSIKLSNTLTYIGERAFYSCFNLKYIVIPLSVVNIESNAFRYCSSLTIYCESNEVVDSWNNNWNYSYRPVYYSDDWEYIDGIPTCKK